MIKKPIIGVTPLFDSRLDSLWMLPCYLEGIQNGGGIPVILPLAGSDDDIERLAGELDGFLFTGGHDVDPALYGQEKLPFCGEIAGNRDEMEIKLFNMAMRTKKPIFGICRGFQLINVLLGGTLYQDIGSQAGPTPIRHSQGKPYDRPSHNVRLFRDTPIFGAAGRTEIAVNSLHHQAVLKLAVRLEPAAESPDGILEAAYMPDEKFVLGVQWHPEFLFKSDPVSASLFKIFVEACLN